MMCLCVYVCLCERERKKQEMEEEEEEEKEEKCRQVERFSELLSVPSISLYSEVFCLSTMAQLLAMKDN